MSPETDPNLSLIGRLLAIAKGAPYNQADQTQFDLNTVLLAIRLARWFLTFGAAFFALFGMFMAVYGYFTAYGNQAKIDKAKKTITWVIIGTVVVILSNVILYTIEKHVINGPNVPIDNSLGPLFP